MAAVAHDLWLCDPNYVSWLPELYASALEFECLSGGRYVDDLTFVQLRNELANGMTSILFMVTAVIAGVLHFFFEKIENRERPEFSKSGLLRRTVISRSGIGCAFASHIRLLEATNSDLTLVVFAVYAIASLVASLFTSGNWCIGLLQAGCCYFVEICQHRLDPEFRMVA